MLEIPLPALGHVEELALVGRGRRGVLGYRVFPSEEAYRRLQRRADRLCFLIVASDLPEREINIERLFLRTEAARLFPEMRQLYDMLYESRFRRLLAQFRGAR